MGLFGLDPFANSHRRPRSANGPVALMRGALLGIVLCIVGLAASPAAAATCANVVFDRTAGYGHHDPATLANPNICGVDIMMDWAAVETSKGTYDFAPADAQADAWARAGKTFVIVIRYTNEFPRDCTKPQNLPGWEMKRIPYLCDRAMGSVIPNYFDKTFLADFKAYVSAVAEHFKASPVRDHLLYVRIGVGLGSEGFFLRPCRRGHDCDYDAAMAKLKEWGFSLERWAAWQKDMMSFYQDAFAYSKVIYPIVNLGINPATGQSIQNEVSEWAVARGMGLGGLGLRPGFGRGPARIVDIFTQAKTRHPKVLLQLQTFRPVPDAEELAGDIEIAKQLGAQTVEWYGTDVNDPRYQKLFRGWMDYPKRR